MSGQRPIVMGSDSFGFPLKEDLKAYLIELGYTIVDLDSEHSGETIDYPDVALALANRIAKGDFDRGILICGTGIGMAMVANKVPGVRAACAHDPYSAERSRKSNDAQILTMGSQIVGTALARQILDHWLASEFAGGRSAPKVAKIKAMDEGRGRIPSNHT